MKKIERKPPHMWESNIKLSITRKIHNQLQKQLWQRCVTNNMDTQIEGSGMWSSTCILTSCINRKINSPKKRESILLNKNIHHSYVDPCRTFTLMWSTISLSTSCWNWKLDPHFDEVICMASKLHVVLKFSTCPPTTIQISTSQKNLVDCAKYPSSLDLSI
jgi:hypothetical protein